ncbi:MAG: hypothetical protein ABJP87_04445 [Bauldia litoralis]|uniref:hypothetical protein n=1 Tax=Bauldia litoralis TaxID=665467 RepID=UPI00329999F3
MGAMHPNLVARLLKWTRRFTEEQLSFYFTFKVSPVDRARNDIVEFFLKGTVDRKGNSVPYTHLLFIDADTIPPEDALKRLLSHDKEIVSGLTPILHHNGKGWDVFDNCFLYRDTDNEGNEQTHMAQRGTGLQKIMRCGSSCILIKREVFEKLKKPCYFFRYNETGTKHTKSEDIGFCDDAKAAGFEIYADTDVSCGHYKEVLL